MNHALATINLYCSNVHWIGSFIARRTELLLFPRDLVASWLQQQPIDFFTFVESNNIVIVITIVD